MSDGASRASISALRAALETAENAMDADAISELLSEDAVLMVPDHPVQNGRTACTAFLREMLAWVAARFDRQITYTSDEVRVAGDLAFDRGCFAFTVTARDGSGSSRVTGKYLWILQRRAADDWIITRLIASRDDDDEPEPPGEAPTTERAAPAMAGGDLGVDDRDR